MAGYSPWGRKESDMTERLHFLSFFPLPLWNAACTSGSSRFTHYWSFTWRILSITLLACKMSGIVWYFEHSLALPFFEIKMETQLFQSCGHCWGFQICWHIECSTFRIWNSSTGIPSSSPSLSIVMLHKAHLTSNSRKSGSRWVITPSHIFKIKFGKVPS